MRIIPQRTVAEFITGNSREDRVKHSGAMHAPENPLAHIDAIAATALSGSSLARYHAYRKVLLAREQNHEAIVSTLTLFVLDLSEASDTTAVISRTGNGS